MPTGNVQGSYGKVAIRRNANTVARRAHDHLSPLGLAHIAFGNVLREAPFASFNTVEVPVLPATTPKPPTTLRQKAAFQRKGSRETTRNPRGLLILQVEQKVLIFPKVMASDPKVASQIHFRTVARSQAAFLRKALRPSALRTEVPSTEVVPTEPPPPSRPPLG